MAKRVGANERMRLSQKPAAERAKPAKKPLPFKPGRIVLALCIVVAVGFASVKGVQAVGSKASSLHLSLPKFSLPHVRMPDLRFGVADNVRITGVRVKGLYELDSVSVIARSGLDSVRMAGDVVPKAIVRKLLADRWIENATVSVSGAGLVTLTIVEREPVSFLVRTSGAICFLDKKGSLWAVSGSHRFDVPLVSGLVDSGSFLSKKELVRFTDFFKRIATLEKEIGQKVIQCDFQNDNRITVRFESLPLPVSFTEATMESRFGHLLAILDRVDSDSAAGGLSAINLCYGSIAYAEHRSTAVAEPLLLAAVSDSGADSSATH